VRGWAPGKANHKNPLSRMTPKRKKRKRGMQRGRAKQKCLLKKKKKPSYHMNPGKWILLNIILERREMFRATLKELLKGERKDFPGTPPKSAL